MPSHHARDLSHPPADALSRVSDRVSFVYVDKAVVHLSDTGVEARMRRAGQLVSVPLPVAATASLLLGPGSSISAPALSAASRAGCVVVTVGADATRTHSWSYNAVTTSRWAQAQALLWADPVRHTAVAVEMYRRRFDEVPPLPHTLERLRGLEGHRMKLLYRQLAAQHGLDGFRRHYDHRDFDSADPVNQALSAANACLYGAVLAAVVSLGAVPQLGFVHSGNSMSFVHDMADLYKARFTVPAAFQVAREADPASAVRRRLRGQFTEARLLDTVVTDLQALLSPGLPTQTDTNVLVADDGGSVPGGRNWSRVVGDHPAQADDPDLTEIAGTSDEPAPEAGL